MCVPLPKLPICPWMGVIGVDGDDMEPGMWAPLTIIGLG